MPANRYDSWRTGIQIDNIYPVGSIYMSVNPTDPGTLFGGAWERIQDTFLLCAGSTYGAGTTGGSATNTLSVANLPSHTHTGPSHSHTVNSHSHTVNSHSHTVNNHSHTVNSHNHAANPWLIGTNNGNVNASTAGSWTYAPSSPGRAGPVTQLQSWGRANSDNYVSGSSAPGTSGSAPGTSGSAPGTSASAPGTSVAGTGATGATGSGAAVNNMPPYLAVYVWKRTA